MQVHVADIRRSDFVRSIPYMFVRQRVNLVLSGLATGVGFVVFICLLNQVNFQVTANAAFVATAGWPVLLFGVAICQGACCAVMAKKAGLLVPFSLTLGEDGVHSQSARSEALLKWSAVAFVRRNKNYIFIGFAPYTFLVVPLRMFRSPEESETFWVRMCDLWRPYARRA